MPQIEDLQAALVAAKARFEETKKQRAEWNNVTDPAGVLLLSLRRIRWQVISARVFQDHLGQEWDLLKVSPLLIRKFARKAVIDNEAAAKVFDHLLAPFQFKGL